MKNKFITAIALASSLAAAAGPLRADGPRELPPELAGVGIDQRLSAQVPLDLAFRDENGRAVKLADYFGKKPVILSLIYYACPMLCTTTENGLLDAVKKIKLDAGKDFEILTVSFDPNDKPMNATAKKSVYVGLYGRPGAERGWHFLTGDPEPVRHLTEAVGFHYTYDENSREFAHSAGIMVLTPEGRVSHYFYGIEYPARDLRLALVEASDNKIGSPVDAVLLFCSQYNPAIGKYGFVISRVLQLAGLVTVLSIGTLVLMMFRAERRARA